ncbi:hypothetical protein EIK77_008234 [Talaromyces pinophilus]|nr:hypothetical protein EIK77_008234 [Talaromyces pinophilus]
MTELTIRPYDNDSDSAKVSTLWQETFPQYPISPQHLETLLTLNLGTHFSQSPILYLSNSVVGFKEGIKCKDLYQSLSTFKAPQYLLDRATSSGITFAPLTSSGAEECIAAQESIFPQWAGGYKLLHSEGLHDDIMVAFDQNGSRQVGWTLMLSPGKSRLWQGFAFLPVVGDVDTKGGTGGNGKTGLIAAVGVRDDVRGKGVGLGLICAAMEEMRRRGRIDGVFIDSVVLDNFYEKVGFKIWREYREFTVEQ